MNNIYGKKVWIFPDGDLPKPEPGNPIEAHEALMILNTSSDIAEVNLTLFFSDKDPIEDIHLRVPARRVICIRMDHPEEVGGTKIPFNTQYALMVESDKDVVATFGRLDTSSSKMSYYTSAWHSN